MQEIPRPRILFFRGNRCRGAAREFLFQKIQALQEVHTFQTLSGGGNRALAVGIDTPQGKGIHFQFLGQFVDQGFGSKINLRGTEAPDRVGIRIVGEYALDRGRHVFHSIRTGGLHRGAPDGRKAFGKVGAYIGKARDLHGRDGSVFSGADLVMQRKGVAAGSFREHFFAAPGHFAGALRKQRGHGAAGRDDVDVVVLASECASDCRLNQADAVVFQTAGLGHRPFDIERSFARTINEHAVIFRQYDGSVRFDGGMHGALGDVGPFQNHIRFRKAALQIPLAGDMLSGDVSPLVHFGGTWGQGLFRGQNCGQGFVGHINQGRGRAGVRFCFRDNDGDAVSDVFGGIFGQHRLVFGQLVYPGQILCRVHGNDAGILQGFCRVDGQNPRMCVGAPDRVDIQHTREDEVVNIPRVAGYLCVGILPGNGRCMVQCFTHRLLPFEAISAG